MGVATCGLRIGVTPVTVARGVPTGVFGVRGAGSALDLVGVTVSATAAFPEACA